MRARESCCVDEDVALYDVCKATTFVVEFDLSDVCAQYSVISLSSLLMVAEQ